MHVHHVQEVGLTYHAIQTRPPGNDDKEVKKEHPVINLWVL